MMMPLTTFSLPLGQKNTRRPVALRARTGLAGMAASLFGALLLWLASAAIAAAGDAPPALDAPGTTPRAETGAALAESPIMLPNPDYRLASGDVIIIELFEQKEIRTAQRLTGAGEVRLPMVGRVSLTGLTVREAEMRIEDLYRDGGFFIDPQIIIFVQTYAARFVSVFGQVRNPTRIPMPEESNSIGILQAVTMAGGFTRIARTDSVQVSRTNEEGVEERFTIDVGQLVNIRRAGDRREFQLLAGDVVFVPERTF